MSQTCKCSSAILAAAPPLPDPRPQILVCNWIVVLHLLCPYLAGCHPLWEDRPCSGHSQRLMGSLVQSKKSLLRANDSPESHPGHLRVTGRCTPFIFEFFNPTCGVWQNFRSLCFSFGISTLEVRKFMPENGWLRSESRKY